ncbi:hypothetical protein TSOC_015006 [Tetrabaena socialis]|uniref:Calcineurin-like phosphoesterase domain-containing protein n=1 Tax=Tetrabaena socialis TaxID=47790 RepID=A0A2J7ZG18_9CHLO|nr:hypothetical protein TSOC_015006 [Tetrabaena socialis]|eukprot:PNG99222.1 hypothetical protein TSOC_015006 [Tetrabaena socialis]
MKFQYISDVHLEKGNRVTLQRHAPNLILAGDIGDPAEEVYVTFIEEASHLFDHVFLVCGNHEYYSSTRCMSSTESMIRDIVGSFENVHFLQNEVFHFPNSSVSVFGATLWTAIQYQNADIIRCMVSDYRCIRVNEAEMFSVSTNNELHERTKQAFVNLRCEAPDRKWVVVCHHMPSKDLVSERHRGSLLGDAYASDVDCFRDDDVVAVVYGHTHDKSQIGKYYCNPYGYPSENKEADLAACFDVSDK